MKHAEYPVSAFCDTCKKVFRVSEENAFGHDPLRRTLACGHVVLKKPWRYEQDKAAEVQQRAAEAPGQDVMWSMSQLIFGNYTKA
jgi:hypothetical protein